MCGIEFFKDFWDALENFLAFQKIKFSQNSLRIFKKVVPMGIPPPTLTTLCVCLIPYSNFTLPHILQPSKCVEEFFTHIVG